MTLNLDDVSRIARLARLELSEQEKKDMHMQLNSFFTIVERMRATDTTGVEPLYTPLSAIEHVALRLRSDEVSETNQRTQNMQNASAQEAGLFLVPRVVE